MQNTSRTWLKREAAPHYSRKRKSDVFYVAGMYDQYWDYIWYASRPGKRKKPAQLLPRFGTDSSMRRTLHACTQLGEPPGKHDYNREWSQWYPGNYDNQDAAISRGEGVISYYEGSQVIQNKIITEIISGKAQLAVDLIELRKTKAMVANAGAELFRLYREVRSGRALSTFIREMKHDGFRGAAGQKWLEYIYGWAPTISGAYETAEILQKRLSAGSVSTGKVGHTINRTVVTLSDLHRLEVSKVTLRNRGYYQFTIADPKLLKLTQLGINNPLAIAWELLPWSFVLDWFVDIGGYINRMDFALGLKDVYWQYSGSRRVHQTVRYNGYIGTPHNPACEAINVSRGHERSAPSQVLINTFKGLKPFTNETVRLTSAVALINQQISKIKSIR